MSRSTLMRRFKLMRRSKSMSRSKLMRRSNWLARMRLIGFALLLAGCAAPPEIEREPPPQAKLATRVKVALAETPGVDAAAVFVDAGSDGRVQLGGFADSAEARAQAEQSAAGVRGVSRVDNQIELR